MSAFVMVLAAGMTVGNGPGRLSGEITQEEDPPPSYYRLMRVMPKTPPWLVLRPVEIERELLVKRRAPRRLRWKCTVVYTEDLNLFGILVPLNQKLIHIIYVDEEAQYVRPGK
jgi:hypothetical protein